MYLSTITFNLMLITFVILIVFRYYIIKYGNCEAQARVRQGLARDGPQGERPQSLNPCLALTLKLVVTHPPTGHLISLNYWSDCGQVRQVEVRGGV